MWAAKERKSQPYFANTKNSGAGKGKVGNLSFFPPDPIDRGGEEKGTPRNADFGEKIRGVSGPQLSSAG